MKCTNRLLYGCKNGKATRNIWKKLAVIISQVCMRQKNEKIKGYQNWLNSAFTDGSKLVKGKFSVNTTPWARNANLSRSPFKPDC